MTAEIAIANKQGIAIAADSAVTIQGERVWKSSNKIFPLSPRNDIAIMISGSGEFNSFPWETVISGFCRANAAVEFANVADCFQSFQNFLTSAEWSNPSDEATQLLYIFIKAIEEIHAKIIYNGIREFRAKVEEVTSKALDELQETEVVFPALRKSDFSKEFEPQIEKFFLEIFEEKPTKKMLRQIVTLCFESFRRTGFKSGFETGIVFCGFGSSEQFPVILEAFVDGRFGSIVKMWQDDCHNSNERPSGSAAIIPFAQRDVAQIFMEAISVDNLLYLVAGLHQLLERKTEALISQYVPSASRQVETVIQNRADQALMSGFFEEFMRFRDRTIVQPILDVVRALPKDEMAAMAQALVEVTSLRRKVDSTLESVGGPVDVAFISKADGFVWLRQKQYFDPLRNPDYDRRRQFREGF